LYSLGLVLYEALAGALPAPDQPRELRRHNPQGSARLAAIVARGLAPRPEHRYPSAAPLADDLPRPPARQPLRRVVNPGPPGRGRDRYPRAAALAEALRRHLADEPLRGVVNRDPLERWRKWRRRRPGALLRLGVLLVAAAAALLAAWYVTHQLDKARAALDEG